MTLIELVIVVVLIGILSAVLAPNFKRSNLQQAANQIISHIRYTQHLALIDDKFSNSDQNWYKKRWQIQFRSGGTPKHWSYVVYHDRSLSGNANSKKEVARDPSDPNKWLIGWKISAIGDNFSKKLDLTKSFGIKDVILSPSCSDNNSTRIAFDYLGRPLKGNISSLNNPYGKNSTNRLITRQCKITLVDDEKNITIAIEPESGYAHKL